eukprot:CAMPEP_0184486240 /NCGR_PEP_ID=MMETSP0113_2-20130426/7765_1 /TAXON_ID=91329 /ORGANISM="Norrisiella sphaerica, Strain BC52" /LENGTH=257 /DNA_ID=CAMNT_0026868023 /DNA_START=32 /DNA_END=805 /DNA_ORIENTATION=-
MESGKYNINDKCGIKTYTLPFKLRKKMALAPERCTELVKHIKKAKAFLKKQGLATTNPEKLLTGELERPVSRDITSMTANMEAEKQRLMDELAGDKTIQYIKKIEEERDYYRKQAMDQTTTSNTMKASLEAARRHIHKLETARPKSGANGSKRWEYSMQSDRYSTLGSPKPLSISELNVKQKGYVEPAYSSPVQNSPAMRASSSYGSKVSTSYGPKAHSRSLATTYARNSPMVKAGRKAMGEYDQASPHNVKFFNFN